MLLFFSQQALHTGLKSLVSLPNAALPLLSKGQTAPGKIPFRLLEGQLLIDGSGVLIAVASGLLNHI